MPRYNPFPVQIGDNPVDTFLVAGTGYSNYNWSGGGNPDVIAPQDTLYVDAAGWYHVTVTNEEGCTAIDSVEVINSEIDLSMDTLFTELVDSCERNVLTDISVLIKNNSLNEFNAGDSLAVAYQVNNEPIVRDTLILQDTLTTTDTGDTVRFTFNDPADFTTPDNYTLKVFTDYQKDLDHSDDTISVTFNTWGYVEIDMAYDTIYSSQADTLKIGTTPGYTDYEWSTAEITDTISPPDNVSRWYKVDVEDDNICGSDSDSVYVETYDMGITVINNPEDACEDVVSPNTSINVTIKNFSGNTYASDDTVRVYYNFDNTGWHHNTITLGSTLNPNSTITKNIGTVDPTEVGAHTLKVYTSAQIDANTSNDLYELEFETWPLPDVELAYDTIFTTKADTVILAAQEGFASYLWNTGETNDTLYVTDKKTKTYSVEVTDVNGCGTDSDSTIIISYNVGISSLVSPKSACEHGENESVRIAVTNYGRDTLDSGTQIPVTLEFEYGEPVNETLTLSGDLNPSGTAYYTFNEQLDLSTAKTYHFKVYTGFELDANQTNDTLVDVRKTFGNPNIELGDDIYTTLADTVILVADPGYNNYSWNNGTNNDSLEVSYPASNNYSVTVTDINGCSTIDDINIYTYDVKATALEAPVSQCELTNAEEVTITVQNNSHDTLLSGETISASYILNSGTPITETFDLTETLYPDSTVDYTFTQTADLSVNQTHEFTLFAKLVDIDVALEDTINASVDFQKTELDLGGDVNVGTEEYTIDAGAEFSTYLWFDESTSQTYTVNINYQTPNKYYAVTVTNSFGCEDADSIMVTFDLEPDIAVTQMLSPESTCWIDGETYPVEIEITNEGVIDLTTGTEIEVGYISDNGDPVTESYALTSDLEASASFNFTFADEISFPSGKEYVIKTFAKLTADENIANDTLPETVNISAPEISLSPYDTIYFEDQVTLNPGNWDQYLWQNGSTNQNFTVTSEGWYSVTVTDEIGCQASDSVYCAKYDPNSIDNLINGDGYSITYYPNPVSEELKIEVNAHKTQDIYIELVNTHGQVIYNTKLSRVRDVVERINVNPYPNGVYYIRFRINNEFFVRKIIFQ
ncbi:MAG: T9SS type A sorting domain-containing protein [Thiohalospira sp.]